MTETARSLPMRAVTAILSILVLLPAVSWILGVPRRLGFSLYTEQVVAASFGAALALLFLTMNFRGRRESTGPTVVDWILAASGLAAAWYVALRYPILVNQMVYRPIDAQVVAAVLIATTLEGIRRTAGPALAIVIAVFLLYGLLGHHLPVGPQMREINPQRLLVYLGLDTNALIGTPLQIGVVIILPFILLGQLLSRSGGGDFFSDLSLGLMGRYRGGAGKVAVTGSALFGSISGSAVANVVSTGIITVPMMKKSGFQKHTAGAVEAVASTGGQLMPPVMGAAAFLMAEFLQVSYGEVLIAALIPSLLYYAALFVQVDLYAAKHGIKAPPGTILPSVLRTLREGWHFPLPFAIFLYMLFAMNAAPGFAALVASAFLMVTTMLFGYRGSRSTPVSLGNAVLRVGVSSVDILVITAGAGLVIGVLNISGLAFSLSMDLVRLSGGNLGILLAMTALASIVLGMGMPTIGVYVLLAALVAPALVQAGVTPMAAHLFVLYFGMLSMVTPPVAIAAFAAANIAKAPAWRTGWESARFGWAAYVIPFLFVLSPTLILMGEPLQIVWAVATAFAGVVLACIGVTGFLFTSLGKVQRMLFVATGILILAPEDILAWGLVLELIGLAFGLALAIADKIRAGNTNPPESGEGHAGAETTYRR